MSLVNGLPAHILLVHFVVVLVPLTALALVFCVIWPKAAQRMGVRPAAARPGHARERSTTARPQPSTTPRSFRAVRNPAPPRPVSPAASTVSTSGPGISVVRGGGPWRRR
jgi:hypothetical protein